jgi:hypothetical protein
MKRRIRPIKNLGDEPVLDRIVMKIIHVPGIMGVISDLMFPKAEVQRGRRGRTDLLWCINSDMISAMLQVRRQSKRRVRLCARGMALVFLSGYGEPNA